MVVLGLEETEYMVGTKRMAHVRNESGPEREGKAFTGISLGGQVGMKAREMTQKSYHFITVIIIIIYVS